MMYAVVYLSSKLGQVTGKGLFHVIKDHYARWLLWPILIGVLIGNTIEAGADLGGMAAAINLFVPLPIPILVVGLGSIILALQLFGSYELIRNVFRWVALALLAYIGSAILSQPDPSGDAKRDVHPQNPIHRRVPVDPRRGDWYDLSAYLYTWQSNVEVEKEILKGRTRLEERRGATDDELRKSRMDIVVGMLFSNIIMYAIILSTGPTLHKSGQTNIDTAAQAAEALRPLAGDAAAALFALGVIGVGFLAVPIMTTGAAYDLCQVMGWKSSLHARPKQATPLLRRHGRIYGDRHRSELPRFQPDEGAGVVRHRSRLLDAAADAADPADDQQPGDHGGAGEQSADQRARLDHGRGDLRRERRARGDLAHLRARCRQSQAGK
jgi:Mn2+/Fe2+ NRAMP family transporter